MSEITKQTFLPTLYKKAANNKTFVWRVSVEPARKKTNAIMTIHYGVLGGEIRQDAKVIDEGKNKGKKNETTPHEQARLEAKSRWEKQLKIGYSAKKDENVSPLSPTSGEFKIIDFELDVSGSLIALVKNPKNATAPIRIQMNVNKNDAKNYISDSWMYSGKTLFVQYITDVTKNGLIQQAVGLKVKE